MHPAAIDRAAAFVAEARLAGRKLATLPQDCRPLTAEEGYAIQDRAHARLSEAGFGPLRGLKIGCTTAVMQRYLGIPEPCAGGVFARATHEGTGSFICSDHHQIGVEFEIAILLGSELPPRVGGYRRGDVDSAVAGCMAAIEVVDIRYEDYGSLGAPTLIADDFFNVASVLASPVRDWQRLDLGRITGRGLVNGVEIGAGTGGDILGHPLEALAWLADRWSRLGRAVPAGAFVSLGSFVQTWYPRAGDVATCEVEGLGLVEARFT
jgi:2-oxo-3-hexenedioate decarboxylase/2-keto-4-pentenoate hydratase